MLNLILSIIFIAIIVIGVYQVVIYLIKMWKGCSRKEAERIIHRVLSGQASYHLSQDNIFWGECYHNIKSVLGEQRYNDLVNFSKTTQTVSYGIMSNLPYIAFTLMYSDDNEKQRLESLLQTTVQKYLAIHSLPNSIRTIWTEHKVLKLPVLYIEFAENEEQEKLISKYLSYQNENAKIKYQPLTDDEEADIDE